jgi:hypothetical protein
MTVHAGILSVIRIYRQSTFVENPKISEASLTWSFRAAWFRRLRLAHQADQIEAGESSPSD